MKKNVTGIKRYVEQSLIDYNDDIFEKAEHTSTTLMDKSIIGGVYTLNAKDEFYVKVKNTNTTMAGAIFNTIVPTSKKERIVVDCGGIVKNNSWAKVDATYSAHNEPPSAPIIKFNGKQISNEDTINWTSSDTIAAESVAYNSSNNSSNEIDYYRWALYKKNGDTYNDNIFIGTGSGEKDSESQYPISPKWGPGEYKFIVYSVDKNGIRSNDTIIYFTQAGDTTIPASPVIYYKKSSSKINLNNARVNWDMLDTNSNKTISAESTVDTSENPSNKIESYEWKLYKFNSSSNSYNLVYSKTTTDKYLPHPYNDGKWDMNFTEIKYKLTLKVTDIKGKSNSNEVYFIQNFANLNLT